MRSTDEPPEPTPSPRRTSPFPGPALWFFVLGGVLLAVRTLVGPSATPARGEESAVVLTEERIRQLWSEEASHLGRDLTEEEKEEAVAGAAEDELFFAEAMSRGLHLEDPRVRERLLELLTFAELGTGAGDEPQAEGSLQSDDELLKRALELELHRRDALVHGWIVERGRMAALAGEEPEDPGDEVLQTFLDENRQLFRRPAGLRFRQLFFDSSKRRDKTEEEAALVLSLLEAGRLTPQAAAGLADRSPLATGSVPMSRLELQQELGRRFADEAFDQEVGRWSQPIRSRRGFHLIFVEEILEGSELPLEEVRAGVLRAWTRQQKTARKEKVLRELQAEHGLRIERPEPREEGG